MAKASKPAETKAKVSNDGDEKQHYQEWDVKITRNVNEETKKVTLSYEKLKVVRPVVKITEEQATILNTGVLEGGNTYARMYFLPE